LAPLAEDKRDWLDSGVLLFDSAFGFLAASFSGEGVSFSCLTPCRRAGTPRKSYIGHAGCFDPPGGILWGFFGSSSLWRFSRASFSSPPPLKAPRPLPSKYRTPQCPVGFLEHLDLQLLSHPLISFAPLLCLSWSLGSGPAVFSFCGPPPWRLHSFSCL